MNERNEPIHIHCEKAEKSCKYWLDVEQFDIIEAYSYGMTGSDKRLVRKIIFQHFDLIVEEWERIQDEKIHKVEQIRCVDDQLSINIDGQEHHFRLADISSKLAAASEAERNYYRVMASGYGIHWPLLDEDLSIDGLLGITHTPSRKIKHQQRKLQMA